MDEFFEHDVCDLQETACVFPSCARHSALRDRHAHSEGLGHRRRRRPSGLFQHSDARQAAERYTTIREFGAVGNGLSYALGVAAARRQSRDGRIVLFEGDGGLLFHIKEFETLKRHGYRILDLRNERRRIRLGVSQATRRRRRRLGRVRPARVRGHRAPLGLRGHEIRDVPVIPKLFADFTAQGEAEIWNIQITDQVTAPIMRQTVKRGHGNTNFQHEFE
jgi:hypothetical protein